MSALDDLRRRFAALSALRDDADYGERLCRALARALAWVESGDEQARRVALAALDVERARLLIAVARARGSGFWVRDMPVRRMLAGVRAFGWAKLLGSDPGESDAVMRRLESELVRHAYAPDRPAAPAPDRPGRGLVRPRV